MASEDKKELENILKTIENFAKLKGFAGQNKKKEAQKWYKDQVSDLQNISRMNFLGSNKEYQAQVAKPGQMLFYFYAPKYKKTLPYYDSSPLIFKLEDYPKHFLGINLHYLPPTLRLKLFQELMKVATSNMRDDQRLKINYDIISSISRYYSPCIKKYLKSKVRSNFVIVPPKHWLTTTFLPLANFKKASNRKVWADSRKIIGKS